MVAPYLLRPKRSTAQSDMTWIPGQPIAFDLSKIPTISVENFSVVKSTDMMSVIGPKIIAFLVPKADSIPSPKPSHKPSLIM